MGHSAEMAATFRTSTAGQEHPTVDRAEAEEERRYLAAAGCHQERANPEILATVGAAVLQVASVRQMVAVALRTVEVQVPVDRENLVACVVERRTAPAGAAACLEGQSTVEMLEDDSGRTVVDSEPAVDHDDHGTFDPDPDCRHDCSGAGPVAAMSQSLAQLDHVPQTICTQQHRDKHHLQASIMVNLWIQGDLTTGGFVATKLYCLNSFAMASIEEGSRPRGKPKRTWREVVEKDCQARKLNKEDAIDHSR